jgi:hypothetical protein
MWDDDGLIAICKVGGPFCLFVCTPLTSWILYKVLMKSYAAGEYISLKLLISDISIPVLMFLGSAYACRVGLGWFGGKKK